MNSKKLKKETLNSIKGGDLNLPPHPTPSVIDPFEKWKDFVHNGSADNLILKTLSTTLSDYGVFVAVLISGSAGGFTTNQLIKAQEVYNALKTNTMPGEAETIAGGWLTTYMNGALNSSEYYTGQFLMSLGNSVYQATEKMDVIGNNIINTPLPPLLPPSA